MASPRQVFCDGHVEIIKKAEAYRAGDVVILEAAG